MLRLKTLLLRALAKPGYRYVFVGGSVYIFELIVIVVAQHLGAGSLLAVGLSFWLGLLISFALQKMVTFKDRRMHRRIVAAQLLAYGLLVLFNFGFTLLVTNLLTELLPLVVIRTLALGVTTIWNFYLYKTKIFNTVDEGNIVY